MQTGYEEEAFYNRGSEALAQVAQRGDGSPVPEGIQGQSGPGSEQADLAADVSVRCKGVGLFLKVPSNSNDSMILCLHSLLELHSEQNTECVF